MRDPSEFRRVGIARDLMGLYGMLWDSFDVGVAGGRHQIDQLRENGELS